MGVGGTSAVAADNSVNINGGSFYQVTGGYAQNSGGSATADNNTVHFASGTVDVLYGGHARGGALGAASASGNHVIISGGTVTVDVYGGKTYPGANLTAANNTVTILGSPDLSEARLYGGLVGDYAAPESGNTLEVKTPCVTVRQISAF